MTRTSRSTLVVASLLALPAVAAEVTVNNRHFTLPDGFTIELVAAPPLVTRPITADFDDQGRLYIADSSGSSEKPAKQLEDKPHRILRLESTKHDGVFDKQTVFADRMSFPEGTMWLDGSLYVAAPPVIWKLTDTNGDGVADQRTVWFDGKTLTGCANDLHGPYAGPDGYIYWTKGAFAEQTYEVGPKHKPFTTRAAHVFRAKPDGTGIEPVMTGGMDNPVEVTFTAGGERIVSSTFLHNPAAGLRDGLIHALYGGIYPKVHDDVTDGHPHTFPDYMPVLVNTGPAAECAVTRYEGDAFGADYRDNVFASSFNLHKVTRHVLTADGATFKATNTDFLVCDNADFHPTHLLEDADGSLLIVDTGGWYKICCPTSQLGKPDVMGAIYRVRRTDAKPVDDPRGLNLPWDQLSPEELCNLLDDPRFTVRRRAIATLGKRGSAAATALAQWLKPTRSPLARVNAAWAAARLADDAARSVCRTLLKDPDETVRQAAAHAASLRRDATALPELLVLLHSTSAQNRRVAAEAISRIGNPTSVPALLAALAENPDHSLEHSLTFALIEIADGPGTQRGLSSGNPHVRRAAMMALDQMDPRGPLTADAVAKELSSPDAALRDTAAWIAARHDDWGDALAGALKVRLDDPHLSDADRDQLSRQLARLAGSEAIQKLIVEQLASNSPARPIALSAIGQSGLDPLPASWVAALSSALDDRNLISPVAAAIRKLPAKATAPLAKALRAAGSRSDLSADPRLDALSAAPALTDVSPDLFTFLTSQLGPDQPAPRRMLAADVLSRAALSPDQLSSLADSLRSAGPLEINKLLQAYAKSKDEAIGVKLLASLKESKSLHSLRADAVKARLGQFGPRVKAQAEELFAKLNPDAAERKAKLDELMRTLPKGDVRRGQAVFNSPKVSCVSCHAIGYLGGHVGPDLTAVGTIRSERDLLESIVFPSASFAQSFEPYTAITTKGDRYDGILRRNDADGVLLVTGPDQEVRIPRADLKELRPGALSIMPAGLDQQLSPQELADLVAFLKATKWGA